jgi:hypothetical protein
MNEFCIVVVTVKPSDAAISLSASFSPAGGSAAARA